MFTMKLKLYDVFQYLNVKYKNCKPGEYFATPNATIILNVSINNCIYLIFKFFSSNIKQYLQKYFFRINMIWCFRLHTLSTAHWIMYSFYYSYG